MSYSSIKITLLEQCFLHVNNRREVIKRTIDDIVESLTTATKSSAGDKHETSRAMLQIEREQAGKQLLEIEKLHQILTKINLQKNTPFVGLGSLVITSSTSFFISISLGVLQVRDKPYFCIGLQTPVGKLLLGKKKGDEFVFNNQHYIITTIL